MIDFYCTIKNNILDKIKKLSLQMQADPKGFRQLLSLIIVDDMIQWAEDLDDASATEANLVLLKEHLLRCYSDNLKLCYDYTSDSQRSYTNVNTPQGTYDWNRIWDTSGLDTMSSGEVYIPIVPEGVIDVPVIII